MRIHTYIRTYLRESYIGRQTERVFPTGCMNSLGPIELLVYRKVVHTTSLGRSTRHALRSIPQTVVQHMYVCMCPESNRSIIAVLSLLQQRVVCRPRYCFVLYTIFALTFLFFQYFRTSRDSLQGRRRSGSLEKRLTFQEKTRKPSRTLKIPYSYCCGTRGVADYFSRCHSPKIDLIAQTYGGGGGSWHPLIKMLIFLAFYAAFCFFFNC